MNYNFCTVDVLVDLRTFGISNVVILQRTGTSLVTNTTQLTSQSQCTPRFCKSNHHVKKPMFSNSRGRLSRSYLRKFRTSSKPTQSTFHIDLDVLLTPLQLRRRKLHAISISTVSLKHRIYFSINYPCPVIHLVSITANMRITLQNRCAIFSRSRTRIRSHLKIHRLSLDAVEKKQPKSESKIYNLLKMQTCI